ncbi:MAG: ion transporter [Ignavibacteriales bacterium]
MNNLKRRIFEIVEDDISESLAHKVFEFFIITLIISNVFIIVIEPFVSKQFFVIFEIFSVGVFSIEYLIRIWTADLKYSGESNLKAKLKFIISPMGIIDLVSILPFYISILLPRVPDGRILRVLRLIRLFKLTHYFDSFRVVKKVFMKRKSELIVTGFIAFTIIFISSVLMYEVEHDAQPDKFIDILSSFWWAIATLTTIGYGDVYPITHIGKFIGALISLVGIGVVALPTGLLSSGFIEEFKNSKDDNGKSEKIQYCPHCGEKLDITG